MAEGLSDRGRPVFGPTPPGQGPPCSRQSPLTGAEVAEAAAVIAAARRGRHAAELPERLRTRDWDSVVAVLLDCLFPALEIGDTVFLDWYGSSGYYGTCLDNGGGAALVCGPETRSWHDLDLPAARMDASLNGHYIKSGQGRAAMGHPITSLTWTLNWARAHGRAVRAGDIVSTGTCTGHLFAAPGDTVRADFGPLGVVEASFA